LITLFMTLLPWRAFTYSEGPSASGCRPFGFARNPSTAGTLLLGLLMAYPIRGIPRVANARGSGDIFAPRRDAGVQRAVRDHGMVIATWWRRASDACLATQGDVWTRRGHGLAALERDLHGRDRDAAHTARGAGRISQEDA